MALLWLGTNANAAAIPTATGATTRRVACLDGPHCGIYSLCAAASAVGRDLEITRFLARRYIGCDRGSSISELMRAANDAGMYSCAYDGLTFDYLATSATNPVVLHVRSSAAAAEFDHYVVALGPADGNLSTVRVVDPSGPTRAWSRRDFAERWAGRGIVIASAPISDTRECIRQLLAVLRYAPIAVVALFAARRVGSSAGYRRSWVGSRAPPVQGALLLVSIAAAALACHITASAAGITLGGGASSTGIDRAYRTKFLATVSCEALAQQLKLDSVTLIDSRYPDDYAAGHVPGSLNLPASSDKQTAARVLQSIDRRRMIIVYCQSRGCPFSDQVANILLDDGFHDVRIYRGGWDEWVQRGPTTERR